jgi:hypothetical protein
VHTPEFTRRCAPGGERGRYPFYGDDDTIPLGLKNEQTKVTISLSSESVAFFKEAAKKHPTQYQKMIRQLLDEYVAQQKALTSKSSGRRERRG